MSGDTDEIKGETVILNITRQQYLVPHDLDAGAKLWELCARGLPGSIVLYLCSNEWKGDEIAVIAKKALDDFKDCKDVSSESLKKYKTFMKANKD